VRLDHAAYPYRERRRRPARHQHAREGAAVIRRGGRSRSRREARREVLAPPKGQKCRKIALCGAWLSCADG
jgi:hypothetical protein